MFTGIIEEIGTIKSMIRNGANTELVINANKVMDGTQLGDSIAVNGVCLTVKDMDKSSFSAFAMAETMRRTAFADFKTGTKVNLERAMSAGGRFGGHMVSGHIDGTGSIVSFKKEGEATWIEIHTSQQILKYIVEKGSIAINGISLTVAWVGDESFKVSIIPHTGNETTLLTYKTGDILNLENDIIGKYVERMLSFKDKGEESLAFKAGSNEKSEGLTLSKLIESGF